MGFGTDPGKRAGSSPSSEPVLIGEGTQGAAYFFPESKYVQKQFRSDGRLSVAELANWEFTYLRKLSPVLLQRPFVQCPYPIDVDLQNGSITMSYVAGVRLDKLLFDPDVEINEADLAHISEGITLAITDYVRVFHEPYYSIGLHNMLYDPSSRIVSIFDFTSNSVARVGDFSPGTFPVELSIGVLMGRTLFTVSVIARARQAKEWKRVQFLLRNVLALTEQQHRLAIPIIRSASGRTFRSLVQRSRGLKWFWQISLGWMMFTFRNSSILGSRGVDYDTRLLMAQSAFLLMIPSVSLISTS